VCAFLLSLGFQLLHKTSCSEGGSLTRHSHYARVRPNLAIIDSVGLSLSRFLSNQWC
jgi:hypothetical protein